MKLSFSCMTFFKFFISTLNCSVFASSLPPLPLPFSSSTCPGYFSPAFPVVSFPTSSTFIVGVVEKSALLMVLLILSMISVSSSLFLMFFEAWVGGVLGGLSSPEWTSFWSWDEFEESAFCLTCLFISVLCSLKLVLFLVGDGTCGSSVAVGKCWRVGG